jgi:hypothetical protein
MKIIQSFSQFSEGSPYAGKDVSVELNFYTFLLSYLTLKRYYGSVMMHCNMLAHNTFVKFIPYDEIVIRENENDFGFWNFYKIDSIRDTEGDVVHVDSDVALFNPLLDEFVHGRRDGIVQDVLTPEKNLKLFIGSFVNDNKEQLKAQNIFDSPYDGRCYSCGVLGMRDQVKPLYFEMVKKLRTGLENGSLKVQSNFMGGLCEELSFYLIALKHGLSIHEILPYDQIKKFGQATTGNNMKYTHLWFGAKFKKKNVELIKQKIRNEYTQDYHWIENFENHLNAKKITLNYLP